MGIDVGDPPELQLYPRITPDSRLTSEDAKAG